MMTKDKLRQLKGDERLGQMRESEYLGAEDIDDGVEPVLTIAGLWNGTVTLQRGKENKDVLSFAEERVPGIMQVRPLIVNSTNRKTLRKLFGDAKASTLMGKQIQRPFQLPKKMFFCYKAFYSHHVQLQLHFSHLDTPKP